MGGLFFLRQGTDDYVLTKFLLRNYHKMQNIEMQKLKDLMI